MKPRVIIGPAQLKAIPHTFEPILAAAGLEPLFPQKNVQMLEEDVLAQLPGCVAALAGSEPYTPRVLEAARTLVGLGFKIIATSGTQRYLGEHGIAADRVLKASEGRPNIVDAIKLAAASGRGAA